MCVISYKNDKRKAPRSDPLKYYKRKKKKREYKTNNILTEVKIYQKDMPIKQFKTVAYYVIQ